VDAVTESALRTPALGIRAPAPTEYTLFWVFLKRCEKIRLAKQFHLVDTKFTLGQLPTEPDLRHFCWASPEVPLVA
jgi:hypothetical protein